MKGLIGWFAANPVAANLLLCIVVAGGWVSANAVRQETFPNVAFDVIHVGVA